MHIKLYSKLDPRRLAQPVRDIQRVQELLSTVGEPLIIEALFRQRSETPLHVWRDATFIGDFVSQIIVHGDADVRFLDARVVQPVGSRYTVILAEDFSGQLSVERSHIRVVSRSKDVALAGIGSATDKLSIKDSTIDGGIFYVNNLELNGTVTFASSSPADFSCHMLYTDQCALKLKQQSVRHDVDMVDVDQLVVNGKCVLSGGFDIGELVVADQLKSVELLTLTSHFDEPSLVRCGSVVYKSGRKQLTHIYLKHTQTHFLDRIDTGLNIGVNQSVIQLDAIEDGAKWTLEKDVRVLVDKNASSGLKELNIAEIVDRTSKDANKVVPMERLVDKKATEKIREMIGQPLVKQQLEDFIAQSEMDKVRVARGLSDGSTITRNMVFTGPPGVGKTEFARLVGQALYENGVLPENKLVEVSAARDLIAGYKGQTAEKTHEVAASAYGGVLFVDEAYALLGDASEGDFEAKAVQQLLKEAEDHRDELVVILAGYDAEMRRLFEEGNSGLKRRFPYWITFENYNHEEFVDIFKLMLKRSGSTVTDSLINSRAFHDLIDSYAGSNANAGGVRTMLEALILARDSRLRKVEGEVSNEDLLLITDTDLALVYRRRVADLEKEKQANATMQATKDATEDGNRR